MKARFLPGVWGEGSGETEEAKGSTGVSGYKAPGPAESFLAHWQEEGEGSRDLSPKAKGDPEKLGSHQRGKEVVGSLGPHSHWIRWPQMGPLVGMRVILFSACGRGHV